MLETIPVVSRIDRRTIADVYHRPVAASRLTHQTGTDSVENRQQIRIAQRKPLLQLADRNAGRRGTLGVKRRTQVGRSDVRRVDPYAIPLAELAKDPLQGRHGVVAVAPRLTRRSVDHDRHVRPGPRHRVEQRLFRRRLDRSGEEPLASNVVPLERRHPDAGPLRLHPPSRCHRRGQYHQPRGQSSTENQGTNGVCAKSPCHLFFLRCKYEHARCVLPRDEESASRP